MIKIVIPDEIDDGWFAERKLDRMKCNMFVLELDFDKNDAVAIGKIQKEFNLSHSDAVNVFLNAVRDQIASLDLLDKVVS